MVYLRKRLAPEILGEVNELIIRKDIERKEKAKGNHDDDDNDGSSRPLSVNKGLVIIYANCAPSKIMKYISQLLESRKALSSKYEKRFKIVHFLYEQQKYMYDRMGRYPERILADKIYRN